MSTGLNCEFLDVDHKWYYILEHDNAPKNAWDWREFASAYGPFGSFDAANKHLQDNHANPGGHSIVRYMPGERPDAVWDKLIAEATVPQRWHMSDSSIFRLRQR